VSTGYPGLLQGYFTEEWPNFMSQSR